jgi:hypothetical protein
MLKMRVGSAGVAYSMPAPPAQVNCEKNDRFPRLAQQCPAIGETDRGAFCRSGG